MKNTEQINLNYQELAFIMDIKANEAKDIFVKILDKEKVSVKDNVLVLDLKSYFKDIRSLDLRYDGKNELIFNLENKSRNYKKYLSVKSMVKKKKFTAGKTIFYKICNEEQLSHAKEAFNFNNKVQFPKDN
jgi:hypothetical protein